MELNLVTPLFYNCFEYDFNKMEYNSYASKIFSNDAI